LEQKHYTQPATTATGLGGVENLTAENDGLDVDKESHPGLLMLVASLMTYNRVLLTQSPQNPWKISAPV
jgi:hypothetical protein